MFEGRNGRVLPAAAVAVGVLRYGVFSGPMEGEGSTSGLLRRAGASGCEELADDCVTCMPMHCLIACRYASRRPTVANAVAGSVGVCVCGECV